MPSKSSKRGEFSDRINFSSKCSTKPTPTQACCPTHPGGPKRPQWSPPASSLRQRLALLARPRRAPWGSAVYGGCSGGARGEPGHRQQAGAKKALTIDPDFTCSLTHLPTRPPYSKWFLFLCICAQEPKSNIFRYLWTTFTLHKRRRFKNF